MAALIDIYAKLIIAFVSFIAPVMVYLLSVSSDGIAIVQAYASEQASQWQQIIKNQAIQNRQVHSSIIEASNENLKKLEQSSKKKGRLLNPKRQIYRIFSTLLGSLLLVMLYDFDKDPYIALWDRGVEIALLIASALCFIGGLLIIKQVAWASIDTKRDIEIQKKEKERLIGLKKEEIISPTS